jgi:hypothetical protein
MVTEHFEFAGWTDNLRLANDQVEVVILREAGPRIISLRPLNGFNVFKVVAEESGKSQEETWKIRGGHRLWTAPEISPGQTAKHTEIWAVFSGIRLPHLYDEEGFAEAIDPYLKQLL